MAFYDKIQKKLRGFEIQRTRFGGQGKMYFTRTQGSQRFFEITRRFSKTFRTKFIHVRDPQLSQSKQHSVLACFPWFRHVYVSLHCIASRDLVEKLSNAPVRNETDCAYTDVEFQCRWCVLVTLSVKPEVYVSIKASCSKRNIHDSQDKFRNTGLYRTKYENTGITGFTGHVGVLRTGWDGLKNTRK